MLQIRAKFNGDGHELSERPAGNKYDANTVCVFFCSLILCLIEADSRTETLIILIFKVMVPRITWLENCWRCNKTVVFIGLCTWFCCLYLFICSLIHPFSLSLSACVCACGGHWVFWCLRQHLSRWVFSICKCYSRQRETWVEVCQLQTV